ncbi:MAG: hypothetical protein U0X39_16290 [Bacteroidales bacterium]
MKRWKERTSLRVELLLLPIFVFFFHNALAQTGIGADTTIKVRKGTFIQILDFKTFTRNDSSINIPNTLVKVYNSPDHGTLTFYDSLKSKASKSLLTRALFDLVIINPDTTGRSSISNQKSSNFKEFTGLKIRKIEIRRLNVFGASVENPGINSATTLERLLNSTHVNTNEKIIRKNLLFSEGDSVSNLVLTDNERLIRQLPYIDDARIMVVPVSSGEADVIVITKDVYSIGGDFNYDGKGKGSVFMFDKNIFGMGHEFRIEIPYNKRLPDSPGIGLTYSINNLFSSFANFDIDYYDALGKKTYGFNLTRNLVSSETRYAGGISINQMYTTSDLNKTLPEPEPLKYNLQDYWLMRSFLLNRESVTRLIPSVRYVNNNIFSKPEISQNTYYYLQRFRLYLASLTYSRQKYYKTNLIYSYGRTEDIPYGGMVRLTGGFEENEYKTRRYASVDAGIANAIGDLGYLYFSAGLGSFFYNKSHEQGVFTTGIRYFSNLKYLGRSAVRNFITAEYTRGFGRYEDEYLSIPRENGLSGFKNDSIRGLRRIDISMESVLFSPLSSYGFRFAFFCFADMAIVAASDSFTGNLTTVYGLGVGIRIRNDNLVFKTFQIRLGYYPSPPAWSQINYFQVTGEQLYRPRNFDPGPPSVLFFR